MHLRASSFSHDFNMGTLILCFKRGSMSKPVRLNKSEALLKKPDRKIISNSSPVVKGLSTQINYSTFYHNLQTSAPLINPCKSCGYEVGNLIKCPDGRFAIKCGRCDRYQFSTIINGDQLEIIAAGLPCGGCDE